jgi:hypothetical protein
VQSAFEEERARVEAAKLSAAASEAEMIAAEQLRLQCEAADRAAEMKAKAVASAGAKGKGKPPPGAVRQTMNSSRAVPAKPKTPDVQLKPATPQPSKPRTPAAPSSTAVSSVPKPSAAVVKLDKSQAVAAANSQTARAEAASQSASFKPKTPTSVAPSFNASAVSRGAKTPPQASAALVKKKG